jgi:hypothetical protein
MLIHLGMVFREIGAGHKVVFDVLREHGPTGEQHQA